MVSNANDHRFWTDIRRRVVFIGYLLMLVGATHWPSTVGVFHVSYFDKVVHFMAYALLGWLAAWAFEFDKRQSFTTAVAFVFAIAVFAAIDEITQPFVGRQCDPLDWLADLLGANTGLAIYTYFPRRYSNR